MKAIKTASQLLECIGSQVHLDLIADSKAPLV